MYDSALRAPARSVHRPCRGRRIRRLGPRSATAASLALESGRRWWVLALQHRQPGLDLSAGRSERGARWYAPTVDRQRIQNRALQPVTPSSACGDVGERALRKRLAALAVKCRWTHACAACAASTRATQSAGDSVINRRRPSRIARGRKAAGSMNSVVLEIPTARHHRAMSQVPERRRRFSVDASVVGFGVAMFIVRCWSRWFATILRVQD